MCSGALLLAALVFLVLSIFWRSIVSSSAFCDNISHNFASPNVPTNQINNNQPINYLCLILISVLEYFLLFLFYCLLDFDNCFELPICFSSINLNICLKLILFSKYLFDFHTFLILIPVSIYLKFDLHILIGIPAWFWYLFLFDFHTLLILIHLLNTYSNLIPTWFWYIGRLQWAKVPEPKSLLFNYYYWIELILKILILASPEIPLLAN